MGKIDTKEYLSERYRASMARRVLDMRDQLEYEPWTRRETNDLIERLSFIAGEGINDVDLRVLVRLYNRELIGRRSSDA